MTFDRNFYNGFICKCAEMGLSGESAFNLFQKVAAPPQQPTETQTVTRDPDEEREIQEMRLMADRVRQNNGGTSDSGYASGYVSPQEYNQIHNQVWGTGNATASSGTQPAAQQTQQTQQTQQPQQPQQTPSAPNPQPAAPQPPKPPTPATVSPTNGQRQNNPTPQNANRQTPAAKATPYDFGGELKKLLTPLRDEYKANKAAYKINGVDMVQSFARGIRGRVAEIQKNPNGYSDAYKRKLMASYKRKIDGIRARVNGASKTTGNASRSGSGWQTIVPGISIKPRNDPRYGALDRGLVRKYNDRFLTSLDKSYTPKTPNQTVQTGNMYAGNRNMPSLDDLTPISYF